MENTRHKQKLAELHFHLGQAVEPAILWTELIQSSPEAMEKSLYQVQINQTIKWAFEASFIDLGKNNENLYL